MVILFFIYIKNCDLIFLLHQPPLIQYVQILFFFLQYRNSFSIGTYPNSFQPWCNLGQPTEKKTENKKTATTKDVGGKGAKAVQTSKRRWFTAAPWSLLLQRLAHLAFVLFQTIATSLYLPTHEFVSKYSAAHIALWCFKYKGIKHKSASYHVSVHGGGCCEWEEKWHLLG